MEIVVMGAGAIGSLFGGLLSENNHVTLIGRRPHVIMVNKKGLQITGNTRQLVDVDAVDSVDEINNEGIDLVLLTVKAYDTKEAAEEITPLIRNDTLLLSLQNGLDNIEEITQLIEPSCVAAGVTTHGALLEEPGVVRHTGVGELIIGELDRRISSRMREIASLFGHAGVTTKVSGNIHEEIWKKAIVNSSVNPLTALVKCKNGVLLSNASLRELVAKTCRESAAVAREVGIQISDAEAVEKTEQVIENTAENVSSMLQSLRQGKPTEIDSINGRIVDLGRHHNLPTPYNETLYALVKVRSQQRVQKKRCS